ncbi:mechanosensitive ion channel family protein [Stenoxybacter acetivorans]|uniref:mechanosensitive ion channel family protein n=1 Tax=Stenoxybacter acetivorans TaxID=422441 RepID=UPI000A9A6A45|nr:mechanosensitive ion channel domain-containing protein [Stenoxybacter acetivorans]
MADLSEQKEQLLAQTEEHVSSFFGDLFARQQLFSHLLERNFHSVSGWIELAVCAAVLVLSFYAGKLVIRRWLSANKESVRWPFVYHLARLLVWPVLLLVGAVLSIYLWRFTGHLAAWLLLLAMAARWMIFLRIAVAILREVFPGTWFSSGVERGLSGVLWVVFVLWLAGVSDNIIQILKNTTIPLGSEPLSLWMLITGVISVCLVVMAALWLARLIEKKLMQTTHLDLNLRLVLSKIVKSGFVALAVVIALPMVGINLTVLSVVGGALGVGVGFGLQKIASTYISGFIILADHSIRLGDRLTVNNFTGYVTKITSRFVVLRNTASGTEALVPNDNFISSTVINESYTSQSLQSSVTVQVAYQTDLPLAMKIMEAAAAKQVRVAKNPAPVCFVTEFADSGINLYLSFWIDDPENGFTGPKSGMLLDIWREFNANGIQFPFPQREIRILNDEQSPLFAQVAVNKSENGQA